MKIYNTLTRQKEEIKTITPDTFKIYVCGPTVYNYIHIGNARPLCVFDVLVRYLKYRGCKVTFVQNYTDVDDKIINKALLGGVSSQEIAQKYIKEYQTDAYGLNVNNADITPKVTENIPEIINMITTLINKNFAYEANGDVYFKTTAFAEYGKLSHMPLEELEAGARVDVNDIKQHPMDFVLWKNAKSNEPSWDSPWGKGRPGWHIECSCMAKTFLGDTIDIHGGGQDLIFPHHENEIAQSECANGCTFANYWMHNGHINVDNQKMSKSKGNFFTVRDAEKEYGYEPIRFMMIMSHYRSPINYSVDVITQCVASLKRLYTFKDNLDYALKSARNGEADSHVCDILAQKKEEFISAFEDDFNTADALSCIFEMVRELNPIISNTNTTRSTLEKIKAYFNEFCDVLGILYENSKEDDIPQQVLDLVDKRTKARQDKDFALADKLRDEITALGFLAQETRRGVKISKI